MRRPPPKQVNNIPIIVREVRSRYLFVVRAIRAISYLAPSLPAELFALVVRHIEQAIAREISLSYEQRISGPLEGDDEPFSDGRADLGYLCAPSLRWLGDKVELVPVTVPTDPRAGGRPVYYADVVVPARSPVRALTELRRTRWAYNDRNSRSGWFSMVERVAPYGGPEAFFDRLIWAGSHLQAIELIVGGDADGAAIDSNVLALALRRRPALRERLRVIESWGPFPIQPVVVRAFADPSIKRDIASALLTIHERHADRLAAFGFSRFVAVDRSVYASPQRPDPDVVLGLGHV
jgi:phosphonate transport system substrate-binding protein